MKKVKPHYTYYADTLCVHWVILLSCIHYVALQIFLSTGTWNRYQVYIITLIMIGAFVVIWSLRLYRNDKDFSVKDSQVIYQCIYTVGDSPTVKVSKQIYRCICLPRLWWYVQRVENRGLFMKLYTRLEDYVGGYFN
jgi:hypothetical protein